MDKNWFRLSVVFLVIILWMLWDTGPLLPPIGRTVLWVTLAVLIITNIPLIIENIVVFVVEFDLKIRSIIKGFNSGNKNRKGEK
jgi:hypothetical protein